MDWALRDYRVDGQIGVEKTIDEYITNLIKIFDECKRVLKPSGTCFVVLGDTFQDTNLTCVPDRFAIQMTNPNWVLRDGLTDEERTFVINELVKRKAL